jgi:hypothetical protein
MWYVDTMEYYSIIKKNGVILSASKWNGNRYVNLNKAIFRKINTTGFSSYVETRGKKEG